MSEDQMLKKREDSPQVAATSVIVSEFRKKVAVTAFRQKVYDTISTIPKGYVSTYKHVADAIGCKSSQAVGQALRNNPFAPVVPCHRVIASTLQIGGFSGQTDVLGPQLQKKRKLLKEEGVEFRDDYILADAKQVWTFSAPKKEKTDLSSK